MDSMDMIDMVRLVKEAFFWVNTYNTDLREIYSRTFNVLCLWREFLNIESKLERFPYNEAYLNCLPLLKSWNFWGICPNELWAISVCLPRQFE